jgi:hypothetical protein
MKKRPGSGAAAASVSLRAQRSEEEDAVGIEFSFFLLRRTLSVEGKLNFGGSRKLKRFGI